MMTARELISSNLAVGVGRTQGPKTKGAPLPNRLLLTYYGLAGGLMIGNQT
jgi:hypothetical protein